MTYNPENKLEFDTSGRCLLYLYRPRVTKTLLIKFYLDLILTI